MTHLMDMSLSVTGWSVEPDLLEDIRIELHHSEQFGDTLRVKLIFKSTREALIEGELKDGTGRTTYAQLVAEIAAGDRSKPVIEHESRD
jgi:hypothetical protein